MKVGICTMYYENSNYGGNLQAYALWRVCESLGHSTEQIAYYDSFRIKKIFSFLYRKVLGTRYYKSNDFFVRKRAIRIFREKIPHTKLYYRGTLKKANQKFDAFIVGSDQVWNPSWILPAYTLEFVDNNKIKISYAASIGREILNDKENDLFKSILSRMTAISVREESGVRLLSCLTEKNVEWVLDPTLLLSVDEWDQISTKRLIESDYIFCYYLGDDSKYRQLATEYAIRHNLKIVTLPNLSYQYRSVDESFGDYQLYDVSPEAFISLIKYSKYVFTDSFHATVFAHLYEKEFVVFSPAGKQSRVRMDSLTEMFGTQERHSIGNSMTVEDIERFQSINYQINCGKYIERKEKSLDFLTRSLA